MKGYMLATARPYALYMSEGVIDGRRAVVILGVPHPDDASHNCDAMGCGQEHVILRCSVADPFEQVQRG